MEHCVLIRASRYPQLMTVAADDPRPKKVQIADALREEIAQQSDGQRLASLRALAERFQVTTVTISSALQILMDESLIVSAPNRGYFVQRGSVASDATESDEVNVRDEIKVIHSQIRQLTARLAKLEKQSTSEGGS